MSGPGDEFDLIATQFARLASPREARNLRDDVAVLEARGALVVTVDTIVEGVHFRSADPPDAIARKALRVNLSDIAAKGARAVGYLLALSWPDARSATEIGAFADGLALDQRIFGVPLLGGDTTRTPGPLTVSVTVFGTPLGDRVPARADAQTGDDLWVTGTIGDGVLGLDVLEGQAGGLQPAHAAWLADRYRLPEPRTAFAATLARFAHATMDVSDGLLGDAAKIADASNLRLVIDPSLIPLSTPARAWLDGQSDPRTALARLASGGDDYEVLFTATAAVRLTLREAAADIGLALTRIGRTEAGAGVEAGGFPVAGHAHRLGASTNGKGGG